MYVSSQLGREVCRCGPLIAHAAAGVLVLDRKRMRHFGEKMLNERSTDRRTGRARETNACMSINDEQGSRPCCKQKMRCGHDNLAGALLVYRPHLPAFPFTPASKSSAPNSCTLTLQLFAVFFASSLRRRRQRSFSPLASTPPDFQSHQSCFASSRSRSARLRRRLLRSRSRVSPRTRANRQAFRRDPRADPIHLAHSDCFSGRP